MHLDSISLAILGVIAGHAEPLSLYEIMNRTGFHQRLVSNTLEELLKQGLVSRSDQLYVLEWLAFKDKSLSIRYLLTEEGRQVVQRLPSKDNLP